MIEMPDVDFDPWLEYRDGEIDPVLREDAPDEIKEAWEKWNKELEESNNDTISQDMLDKILRAQS